MHINTIFYQLQTFFPRHEFEKAVSQYQGDRYAKKITCWQQFTTMLYAQISKKNSLRDIETGLKAHIAKWYHLGIKNIARSTISHTNRHRSYQIYEHLFYSFLKKCKSVTPRHKFKFSNPLYTLDTTTIDLCLSMFSWAKFRKAKGGINTCIAEP